MSSLVLFHDVKVVQASAPYTVEQDYCQLSFHDDRGGKVSISLTKDAFAAVKLAIETFKSREELQAAA